MHDKYSIKEVTEEPADIRNTLSDIQMVSILQGAAKKTVFFYLIKWCTLSEVLFLSSL